MKKDKKEVFVYLGSVSNRKVYLSYTNIISKFSMGQFVTLNGLDGQDSIDFSDIAVGKRFSIQDITYDKYDKQFKYTITPTVKKSNVPTLTNVKEENIEVWKQKKIK